MGFFNRLFGKKQPQPDQRQGRGEGLSILPEFQQDLSQAVEGEQRYQQTGQIEALDAASQAWERILAHTSFDGASERFQLATVNNAGGVFLRRYWRCGQIADLDRALGLLQQAVQRTPPDSPDLPTRLNNLGIGLQDRYSRTGLLSDLEEAIHLSQQAVQLTPPDSSELPRNLNNLSNSLRDRYSCTGALTDLEEAIHISQQAVQLTPPDSPNLPSRLNNLGNGLRDRYTRMGTLSDLEEAIAVYQQTVQRTPPDSPDLPSRLNNLGNGLRDRYTRTGALSDLEEAIRSWQQSVVLSAPDSPELPRNLTNLGTGLHDRWHRTGMLVDLEKAIDVYQQAIQSTLPDSPELPRNLSNLGAGLRDRYTRMGVLSNLEEAIQVYQQAVAMTSPDSPELPTRLNNLGTGLHERYTRTGALSDLEEAIAVCQQAVQCTPPDSPNLPMYLNSLGTSRSDYYRHTRVLSDLEEAIAVYQQAVQRTPSDSPNLPMFLTNLAAGLLHRYGRIGVLSDLEESICVSQQAVLRTPLDSPDWPGYQNGLGNGLHERYRRTGALSDLEEAIRSWQQTVDRTPSDSPDLAIYLNNLGNGLRDHYCRMGTLEDLEETISCYRQTCEMGSLASQGVTLACSRTWGDWALERHAWDEACQAYGFGLEASHRLFQTQYSRSAKESWLGEARGLASNAGFAFSKKNDLPRALASLEVGRARLLGESLERKRRDLEQLAEPEIGCKDLLERYRIASQRIETLNRLASRESQPGLPSAKLVDWRKQMEVVQAEIQTVIEQIRHIPGFDAFLLSLTAEQIQQQAQAAPIVYLAVTFAGGLALVVTPDAIHLRWLDFDEAALNAMLVQHDGENLTGGYLPGAFGQHAWLEDSLPSVLAQLGERLMKPVAECLHSIQATAVTLIPSGLLSLLPLHAASYECEGKLVHFIDVFEVSYAASAQALAAARQQYEQRSHLPLCLAGVGNPLPSHASLPYAQAEMEEIASHFGSQTQPLYGEDATKQALLPTLPEASHLHLSCHGQFNPEEPLQSALSLAQGDTLTLGEVLDQPDLWGMRLVVLSACQTAITDFNKLPDEAIGLPGGFTQAGIPGVVGTLWSVSDLSTALVMIRFYEYHLRGDPESGEGPMSPARALRAAQRWLRDVTAGELTAYFEHHKALAEARQQQLVEKRMPLGVAAEGVLRFGLEDPASRPYQDKPYHWAPFVFYGV